ncbi:MAG TPA: class I SAM-dependent methyltransferase [Edaphobacter sp.]|nr:class I SAM-dependent methyltransferase [Edaphobacter sp.]
MTRLVKRVRWSLAHRGVVGTVRSAWMSLGRRLRGRNFPGDRSDVPHPFDVEHGTDTGGLIPGSELGVGHRHDLFIAGYAGVPPSGFRAAIACWQGTGPRRRMEEYTFLDLGCGKGRAVLLASEFGFREAVGVELNPGLAEIARANAAIWTAAGRARSQIRIVCGDAAEVEWPSGPCLVYLYNPFAEKVMLAVVEVMRERFGDRRDELEIVYQKPEQAAMLEGDFEMVWGGVCELSEEDKLSDPVADPRDETRVYRWKR